MTFLDKVIGYFDPEEQLRRVKARIVADHLGKRQERAYDGATKGRRGEGWKAGGTSANTENASAIITLRNRSRELVRNNPYAARGMQVVATNVVGKGIRAAINHENQAKEDKIKEAWNNWAESTDCDYEGRHDLYGIQSLVMRSVVESGEVFIRRRRVRRSEASLPIKLQILESDFLVSEQTLGTISPSSGNKIVQGIEFDAQGRRVAYHFYETHPGSLGWDQFTDPKKMFRTIRVSASDVLHIYRMDRPGQVRGVPWLAPTMLRLRDVSDYEDAQLLRQKLAACYMAFIKDTEMPDLDDEEKEILSKFEPGAIEFLPPGKDIQFGSPPEVSENYAEYMRVMLQSVASGLGVSYEALTGNLKDINFSSSRMGWLEFQRNIEAWRCSLMNVQLNDTVYDWFVDATALEGIDSENSTVTWTAPRREMIDPSKETGALVEAVDNKFKTLSEVVRENGKNPEDHFRELAKERELLDRLGLSLETEDSQKKKQKQKPKLSTDGDE